MAVVDDVGTGIGGGGGVTRIEGDDDEELLDLLLLLSFLDFFEVDFEDELFGVSLGGEGVTSSCLIID